jgi:MFS transporter, DHA1 family, staphyloferrin A biosynthesis exporter
MCVAGEVRVGGEETGEAWDRRGSADERAGQIDAPGGRFRPRLPTALQSLRHRNFRLLWTGNLISQTGDWMDQIALNWLVYQLTGSAFYLGVLNLCRLAPILVFTLVGGVIADRVDRRWLMFTTQTVAMVLAFVLAILVSTGHVEFWMVVVIGVGRGVALAFNFPARQSLISDLVPRELLGSAVALNQATSNLTRVIGPTIGGILIATIGVAGAFYINGLSFVAVLGGLAMMRFPPRQVKAKKGMLADLMGGFRYIQGQPDLRLLVMLALVPMILGQPYMTMLTVFASDVLQVGGSGLGLLVACSGGGAACGALYVASRNSRSGRRTVMFVGLLGYGVALLVFSLSPWFWLSAGSLVAVGFSQQVYNVQNNALIQEDVDPEFRGRVLSTLFLNRGLIPLGTVFAGFGTDLIGAPITLAAMAALLLILAVGVSGRRLIAGEASAAA